MEETIGKRIMYHRKRLKLTQDQLAEQLGVTAQAVSKWENDQSCPDITMLPKLAGIFYISTDTLLGNDAKDTVHTAEVVEPNEPAADNKNGFHIEYSSGRRGALLFALFILGVGIQMLIAALLHIEIGFWAILWPTALLFAGIHGLTKNFSFLGIGCLLFGAYFLLDHWKLFDFKIGGEIIFPVVIVLMGLGLFADAFKKHGKPKVRVTNNSKNGKAKTNYTAYANRFDYSASFSEDSRFVTIQELKGGYIETSFGDYTIDLSGVESIGTRCVLEAHCSFGELNIRVPKRFCVQMDSSTTFAEASIHGQPDSEVCGTIILEAHASFGEISVQYI